MNIVCKTPSYLHARLTCFCRPYGRVDFHIKLPMRPLIWVIGAFSLHQEHGLAFAEYPVRVSIL